MAQDSFVVYTTEMDNIIKEEAKKSPKNLAASFRKSTERIKNELGEPNVTPEKIQARFYLKHNKRKSSSSNGSSKKTKAKAKAPSKAKSSNSSTVKTVDEGVNVTEDVRFKLAKEYILNLSRERKAEIVKELWEEL